MPLKNMLRLSDDDRHEDKNLKRMTGICKIEMRFRMKISYYPFN